MKGESLGGDPKFVSTLERAYKRAGYRGMLQAELKDALSETTTKYVNPVGIADSYAELGDAPHALQWLQKGYEAHASGMQYLAIRKSYDRMRSDPGFQYWLAVMNLPNLKSSSTKP